MSMVERVRTAIREADVGYSIRLTELVQEECTYTATVDGQPPKDFDCHEDAAEYVREFRETAKARAAIEAMREPTKLMIDAAYEAHDKYEASTEGAWCGLSSAYRAMIDATLAEPAPGGSA